MMFWRLFEHHYLFISFIRDANLISLSGYRCPYVSEVVFADSWPRRQDISKRFSPMLISMRSWLCLKSWTRIDLTSAKLKILFILTMRLDLVNVNIRSDFLLLPDLSMYDIISLYRNFGIATFLQLLDIFSVSRIGSHFTAVNALLMVSCLR